jgi:hypothetical protein
MRGVYAVLLVLVAFPALGLGVSIEGPRNPDGTLAMCGTFTVTFTGAAETTGHVTLVVLRTSEVLRVSLECDGDKLKSAPVQIRRSCDPAATRLSLVAEIGDAIAIATELGDNGCTVERVGKQQRDPDEPALSLRRMNNDAMDWVKAEYAEPGLFSVILNDRALDTTCTPDTTDLTMGLGTATARLELVEEGAVSGRFSGEFVVHLQPHEQDPELVLQVLARDKTPLLNGVVREGDALTLTWEGVVVHGTVKFLPVELSPVDLVLPVGCMAEVRVSVPERPDEVLWFVNGVKQATHGLALPICPDTPRTLEVVALVRQGLLWGRQQTTVTIVPQVRVSFVSADTGTPADEPWRCSVPLQVKVEHVQGELESILVGRLGADPRPCMLPVTRVGDGVWLSIPFRPAADLGACGGDVLWVQYVDFRGCYTAYVVLPLR